METRELAKLVATMRHHQRAWFRGKDVADLRESKRLEREVDEAVLTVLRQPTGGLFDLRHDYRGRLLRCWWVDGDRWVRGVGGPLSPRGADLVVLWEPVETGDLDADLKLARYRQHAAIALVAKLARRGYRARYDMAGRVEPWTKPFECE